MDWRNLHMIAGAKRREAAVKAAEEKTAAKAVEAVETKAVKAEAVAKSEPVKAEPVAEAKKTTTKKAAEKAAEKTVEPKTTIILEYCGRQVTENTMIAGAKKVWAEAGHTEAIETMELYVKPEDGAVYCVINGDPAGKFCY